MNDCIKTSLKNKRIEFLLGTTEYKQTLAEVTKTISSRVLSATNEATVVSIFEIELYSLIKDIFELKFFPQKELSVGTNFHVAILNAPIITDYIVNSSDARTFKINPDINIPLFDIQNPIHHKLSKLSIKAHKNYNNIEIMMDIDNELNKLVMSL